jgi:ATP-dependent RNA helicase HelY
VTVTDYRGRFIDGLGFGLDPFQSEAIEADRPHVNVLVSAPTGSGKTLIANYAIGRVSNEASEPSTPRRSRRSPTRSSTNSAPSTASTASDSSPGTRRTIATRDHRHDDRGAAQHAAHRVPPARHLGLVVLDEVHYLQDPFRGGVWEEVIILTPRRCASWRCRRPSATPASWGSGSPRCAAPTSIVEKNRPIQLHNHLAVVKRTSRPSSPRPAQRRATLRRGAPHRQPDEVDAPVPPRRPKWKGSHAGAPPPPFRSPRRSELLRALEREDLLPAIVFIFSRAACDDAVHQCRLDGLMFTTPEQRREIEGIALSRLTNFSDDDLKALEYADFIDCLRRGLSAHHAGMVPAFREIVEICFERNLLAVVFATETLALGVNMPARSVALEKFSKYSDAGRKFLTSAEYSQMTGRAGRRGLDDEGHAIVCFANDVALHDVGRVALAPPSDLHSSFRPTYNFTANLINHFDFDTALEVVQRSYAQFERDHRPAGLQAAPRRPDGGAPSRTRRARLRRGLDAQPPGSAAALDLPRVRPADRRVDHRGRLRGPGAGAAGRAAVVLRLRVQARHSRPNAAKQVTTKKRTVHERSPRPFSARQPQRTDHRHHDDGRHDPRGRGPLPVPHAKEPDGKFATTIAAWARGASLSTVLDLADVEVGQTSPGDFVRNAKQVADLCEQLSRMHDLTEVAGVAALARDAVLRSVVAGASSVHPRDR